MMIAICVALSGCNLPLTATPSGPLPAASPIVLPTSPMSTPSTSSVDPDWKIYADPALGISFSHPADWEICGRDDLSLVLCGPQAEGAAFPGFYLTLIRPNAAGIGYNYLDEETVGRLRELPVGGSITTGNPDPQHSTFTRQPDVQVGGEAGFVVENARVWEGGPATKDRRVFVEHNEALYMIGTYYESAEELGTFQAVLDSLRFG